jgi:membrane protease subunit HflK
MKAFTRGKIIAAAVVVIFFAYLLSGIYFVAPDEEAVVKRFGRVAREGITPGIHYRLPYPMESTHKIKTKVVYKMSVGYRIVDEVRNIPPLEEEMQWLTGDTNVINIRLLIQYTISRPAYYLFAMESPNVYIRNVMEGLLTPLVGSSAIDELLTVGKGRLTTTLREKAQKLLDECRTGIAIGSISIVAIDPPQTVIGAFKDVSDAKLDRERYMNDAQSYSNEILPRARGEAQVLLQEAGGIKEKRILESRGASERFLKILAEYRQAPGITKQRMYLAAMEEILPGVSKYVIDAAPGEKTNLKIFGPEKKTD